MVDDGFGGFKADHAMVGCAAFLLDSHISDLALELFWPLVGGYEAQMWVLNELRWGAGAVKPCGEERVPRQFGVPGGPEAEAVDLDTVRELDDPGSV